MSLRKLLAVSLISSSAGTFAGTADFIEVMGNSKSSSRTGTPCMARFDAQPTTSSHFQGDMLPSATALKANAISCQVGGMAYSASNSHNLFSQQPEVETVAEFARLQMIDDTSLINGQTVLQKAVTH